MDVLQTNSYIKTKADKKSECLLTQNHLAKLAEREERKKQLSFKPEKIFLGFKKGKWFLYLLTKDKYFY